ncbi:MAG TPA: selenocysteine-specific translation elongation factor, partial [Anaerolineaceae bacterium]
HGKSTLVAALTGIHPDRLKEEQQREMTIDLGFAWMTLPNGEQVGIVDVPGHRDFIENMLAGVGGIDAVLFVIAADEGVMPQTREHLAIIDLLQIQAGVIALTKADLVDDPDWFDLVEMDVHTAVQGTVLENAPIVRVSARSGAGLDSLVATLQECLSGQPHRADLGRPRLPIDRVFTIPGFGTVVTGTLIDGHLSLGEEVEVLPGGLRGRIRGLQTHKRKEQNAAPGSRTAVNINGLEVEQIHRGEILAYPGKYHPTHLVDVHFRLLRDASGPLRHSSEVKFFLGTAEVLARVRLLGVEELKPGEEGWLQLELREPSVAVRGDRYILRRPSPGETLGGGVVVDPQPKRRHRRFDAEILSRLESLRHGSPEEVLIQAYQALGASSIRDAVTRTRLPEAQAGAALQVLVASGGLVVLEEGTVYPASDLLAIGQPQWADESARVVREVDHYHHAYPLRRGMPREELKSRLKMTQTRLFNAAIRRWVAGGVLEESGNLVWRPGYAVRFTPQQKTSAERLLDRFAQAPYAPPTIKDVQSEVGEELYQALVDLGDLVPVSAEVVFRRQDYERLVERVRDHFAAEPTLSAAQLRDQLNTSRRYVLAFLEHLDAVGLTVREGDIRKLRQPYSNR